MAGRHNSQYFPYNTVSKRLKEGKKLQHGDAYNAFGIDVSDFQGYIHWDKVKGAQKSFAYIRASSGSKLQDLTFSFNWHEARNAGLTIGAYHNAEPGGGPTESGIVSDAQQQAAVFLEVVDRSGGIQGYNLAPVLALSTNNALNPQQLLLWAEHWLADVDAAVRNPTQIAMLYSDPNFIATALDNTTALSQRPLWIAYYNARSAPPTVGGWNRWTAWQYGDQGHVDGISGLVDLDEWYTHVAR